jgi:hypothetical protein
MVDHASQQHELSELKERVNDKETNELLLESEMRAQANAALHAEERCVKMEGMLKQLHGENQKEQSAKLQLTMETEEKNIALLEIQEQMRAVKSQARKYVHSTRSRMEIATLTHPPPLAALVHAYSLAFTLALSPGMS